MAEEDELLHGENCWLQSENIQMSFNSSDDSGAPPARRTAKKSPIPIEETKENP